MSADSRTVWWLRVCERDHIVEGDSPFEEAAHRGGAGTAKPADIDEAR